MEPAWSGVDVMKPYIHNTEKIKGSALCLTSTALQRGIKNQVLGWLYYWHQSDLPAHCRSGSDLQTIFQLPQLFKAHREGTSEVFWDFLWKEIIGLVVLVEPA